MSATGLEWNSMKCAVIHVKRGECLNSEGIKPDESSLIASLNDGEEYKFLGVLESLMQEEQLALDIASKSYLQRLAIIWSSPLSDYNSHSIKSICLSCDGISDVDFKVADKCFEEH